MILPLSTRLHYCISLHLWGVFSTVTWMEEDKDSSKYFDRVEQWYVLHSYLVRWLVGEQNYVLKEANVTQDSLRSLFYESNNHIDYLLDRWITRWVADAQSFTARAPTFSEGAWCYFTYAAWHRHCIEAFVALMHEPPLRESPWYPRYQAQAAAFHRLIAVRQEERPRLDDVPTAQHADVLTVQQELERLAETFAQEWRDAVEWAAERLPWEQLEPVSTQPDASPPLSADDDDIPW